MNWNDTGKAITAAIVGKVPDVGPFLSLCVNLFWPTSEPDIWSQIRAQVQQLVDQSIADNNLQQLKDTLQGMKDDMALCATYTDPNEIRQTLNALDTTMTEAIPQFLTGDPTTNFSCAWGMAMLHISVRKAKAAAYGDDADAQALQDAVSMYTEYGRTALSVMYNQSMSGWLQLTANSNNQEGRNSNWIIGVDLVDTSQGGLSLFSYHERYTGGNWSQALLDQDTRYCNQQIQAKLASYSSPSLTSLTDNLQTLAFDSIQSLEATYPPASGQGFVQLQSNMESGEFQTFQSSFYPSGSPYHRPVNVQAKTLQAQYTVQLDPFETAAV